jgi:putative peptide zinc metalloprotease protein
VETWLDEEQIKRLRIGDTARFLAPGLDKPLNLRVASIDADATRQLVDGQLAATLGGHILSREQAGKWYPEQAVYRVVLDINPENALHMYQMLSIQRGHLSLAGQAESLLGRYTRRALSVLLREFQP